MAITNIFINDGLENERLLCLIVPAIDRTYYKQIKLLRVGMCD